MVDEQQPSQIKIVRDLNEIPIAERKADGRLVMHIPQKANVDAMTSTKPKGNTLPKDYDLHDAIATEILLEENEEIEDEETEINNLDLFKIKAKIKVIDVEGPLFSEDTQYAESRYAYLVTVTQMNGLFEKLYVTRETYGDPNWNFISEETEPKGFKEMEKEIEEWTESEEASDGYDPRLCEYWVSPHSGGCATLPESQRAKQVISEMTSSSELPKRKRRSKAQAPKQGRGSKKVIKAKKEKVEEKVSKKSTKAKKEEPKAKVSKKSTKAKKEEPKAKVSKKSTKAKKEKVEEKVSKKSTKAKKEKVEEKVEEKVSKKSTKAKKEKVEEKVSKKSTKAKKEKVEEKVSKKSTKAKENPEDSKAKEQITYWRETTVEKRGGSKEDYLGAIKEELSSIFKEGSKVSIKLQKEAKKILKVKTAEMKEKSKANKPKGTSKKSTKAKKESLVSNKSLLLGTDSFSPTPPSMKGTPEEARGRLSKEIQAIYGLKKVEVLNYGKNYVEFRSSYMLDEDFNKLLEKYSNNGRSIITPYPLKKIETNMDASPQKAKDLTKELTAFAKKYEALPTQPYLVGEFSEYLHAAKLKSSGKLQIELDVDYVNNHQQEYLLGFIGLFIDQSLAQEHIFSIIIDAV
jgi:hypothetical protein